MPQLIIESPVGKLTLREEKGEIRELVFGERDGEQEESLLLLEAKRQLALYFTGRLKVFDLPLGPQGTDFQRKVWMELRQIPYGETTAYGELARRIGNPKAARAVGGANHHNPISILIPCHRVIGADGKLVGYGGGLSIKEFLLDLEKKYR